MTRILHWFSAICLAASLASGWAAATSDVTLHDMLMQAHLASGGTVLAITVVRLFWRIVARRIDSIEPSLLKRLAVRAMHLSLYAMMIAQPLLGWLYLSARGRPWIYAGITLPRLVSRNRALAEAVLPIHSMLAVVALGVIALHTSAALLHHFVLRDVTLSRMLRGRVKLPAKPHSYARTSFMQPPIMEHPARRTMGERFGLKTAPVAAKPKARARATQEPAETTDS